MKLSDVIRQEATRVFLDLDGFGQPLTIDGLPTVGIWDDSEPALNGQSLGGVPDVNSFGLFAGQKVLQLPWDAIPAPLAGQRLCIDGEYWTSLSDAKDQMGIMVLKLQRVHA